MARIIVVILVALLAQTPSAFAAQDLITTEVLRTLIREDRGQCMVQIDASIRNQTGLDCNGNWITMSCNGEFLNKAVAYRMLDSAQMALALDKRVSVMIDDSRKQSGRCLATRIDVWKE